MRALRVLLFVSLGSVPIVLQAQALAKTFRDPRTNLLIHFPADWYMDKNAEVFTITSFPPNERPRMILVPMNEGEVEIMSPPPGVHDMKAWLRFERITRDVKTQITPVVLDTVHNGKVPSTQVSRKLPVFDDGWSTEYFFTIKGHLYKARAFYRGQEKRSYFDGTLLAIVDDLEGINW